MYHVLCVNILIDLKSSNKLPHVTFDILLHPLGMHPPVVKDPWSNMLYYTFTTNVWYGTLKDSLTKSNSMKKNVELVTQ